VKNKYGNLFLQYFVDNEDYVQKISKIPFPDTTQKVEKYPSCSIVYITNNRINSIVDVYKSTKTSKKIDIDELSLFVSKCLGLDDCKEYVEAVMKQKNKFDRHKRI